MSTRKGPEPDGTGASTPPRTGPPAAALSLFDGGGEMGARMSVLDWSKTAVGPVQTWPQSLKTAVRIMLSSRYAMWMGWGPEFTFFCNDAYLPTVGDKQAWVLGASARKVWAEIWQDIGPRAEAVLQTGVTTWDEGLLLFLERSGFPEETYHTFSYSPLPDDDGTVGGMLCVVTEETTRAIGERRLALLHELAADLAGAHTEREVCAGIERNLGSQPRDVPFTLTYLFDEDGRSAQRLCATGIDAGGAAAPQILSLDEDGPWPGRELLTPGARMIVADWPARCGAAPRGSLDKPARQVVVMPLAQQGQARPAGFMVLGVNPYRPLDTAYQGFFELLAGQIASGLASAHAYAQERKRAEALAELDRAKTAFFSNVSHEFRTPLTLILGPLEDALGDAVTALPAEQRARVVTAHRNSLRLLKLVNTLLDFSRIEAGRLKAVYEPTELGTFTAELASNFRSACERVGLTLTVHCPDLGEPVYVDRDMWEKVVLNLLSNAFKFTLKGEIRVSLRRIGDRAELVVEDTGIGIAATELPHLFERFHRVEGARGRSLEGTGIGLALAQELVKLHGGTIRVRSEVDQGTAFTVDVPLGSAHLAADRVREATEAATPTGAAAFVGEALRWLPGDGSAAADEVALPDSAAPSPERLPERSPAPLPAPSAVLSGEPSVRPSVVPDGDKARARILLADDNADMRDYIRRLLEPVYEVLTVTDGRQALRTALAERPDLVLTDVMMPNLDGFGLLKALRADVRTAATPIIMLSARAGEEARVEGHTAGADDYVIKPFSARELTARISGTLALSRLRREIVRREEELKAEKTMVLESIQEAFIAVDASWRLTYVNAQAERIYRTGREAYIGRDLWEAFPGLAETVFGRGYRQAMEARVTVHIEEYYRPFARWFEVSICPLSDGGVGTFFRDISARKRTEAIVTGQKQALEMEVDGASLEHVLEVLTRIVETQSGEGIRASILLLDTDGLHLRHGAAPSLPESFRRTVDGLRIGPGAGACGTAAYTRQTVVVSDIQTDPLCAEFRELAREHGICACWSSPLFSSRGSVLGTFALYYPEARRPAQSDRDVVEILARTAALVVERRLEVRERLAAEAALRDNEQRYRQLVHSLPAAVYTCDARGYVTLYNEAAAALWGREPALGKELWCSSLKLYRLDGTELPHDQIPMTAAIPEGRTPPATEFVIERTDGSRRHVLAHLEPIRDYAGEITGALNILVDITERKQAEDALKEADRRKDEFLATLSHELRNPLAPIRSGLHVLRMNGGADAITERVYGMMERQVNHLVRLVDDLLEISRITRGKIDLRLEDVSLAAVVRSAIDTSRPLIEAAEHQLSVSIAADSLMVRADPVRLSQVIANLLNNAAKYTPRKGHIWLTVEPHGREVRIAVRDDGVGIPSDMLPRVFELFTQVDRTQKQSQGGLGIGLALVKSLVAMHHGRVEAHSAGLDRGSEFVVHLPLLETHEAPVSAHAPRAESPLPPLRILIVDDSRDAAESLGMMLRLLGCEVYTAHDGPSGLVALAQHRPDVALLDIGMPGMDGYEVARRARQQPELRGIVLIALTGWGQAEDRVQSDQAGFDHHLVKPVELPVLQALLSSSVGAARVPKR